MGEEFVADEPFLLTFGDLMLSRQLPGAGGQLPPAAHLRRITANWMEDPSAGAAVTIADDERLVRIVEKPPKGTAESNWNNAGIFVFTPDIFAAIRRIPLSPRGELELTAAIQLLADERGDVTVYRLEGLWSDVGNPARVLALNRAILTDTTLGVPVARCAEASGQAVVEANCAVAAGAELASCQVLEHSCVAAGTRVREGAVLRESTICSGGEVGAGCRLGAIVAPGARVADGTELRGTPEQPAVAI